MEMLPTFGSRTAPNHRILFLRICESILCIFLESVTHYFGKTLLRVLVNVSKFYCTCLLLILEFLCTFAKCLFHPKFYWLILFQILNWNSPNSISNWIANLLKLKFESQNCSETFILLLIRKLYICVILLNFKLCQLSILLIKKAYSPISILNDHNLFSMPFGNARFYFGKPG